MDNNISFSVNNSSPIFLQKKEFENLRCCLDLTGKFPEGLFEYYKHFDSLCLSKHPFRLGNVIRKLQIQLKDQIKKTGREQDSTLCFNQPNLGDIELDSNLSWRILLNELDPEDLQHVFFQTSIDYTSYKISNLVENYHSLYPPKMMGRAEFTVYCTNKIAQNLMIYLVQTFKTSFPFVDSEQCYVGRELKAGIEIEFYFDNGAVCFKFIRPSQHIQNSVNLSLNFTLNTRKAYIKLPNDPTKALINKLNAPFVQYQNLCKQNNENYLKQFLNIANSEIENPLMAQSRIIHLKNTEDSLKNLLNIAPTHEKFPTLKEEFKLNSLVHKKKDSSFLESMKIEPKTLEKVLIHSDIDNTHRESDLVLEEYSDSDIDDIIKECEEKFGDIPLCSDTEYQEILNELGLN